MARGTFLFVSNNDPTHSWPSRTSASATARPDLSDCLSRNAIHVADRILFFRDNGQLWLMKDRNSDPTPAPRLLHDPSGWHAINHDRPTMEHVADIEARSHAEYETWAVSQPAVDVKTLLKAYTLANCATEDAKRQQKAATDDKNRHYQALGTAQLKIERLEKELAETKKKLADVSKPMLGVSDETRKFYHRPVRPDFVEVIRKALVNDYETHSRGSIISDLRSMLRLVDETTRPQGIPLSFFNTLDIRESPWQRQPLHVIDEMPMVSIHSKYDYGLPLAVPAPSKFPPREGDVWSWGNQEWRFTGRTKASGGWSATYGTNKSICSWEDRHFKDGTLTFVRRGKPKMGVELSGLDNHITLTRLGDTTTVYSPTGLRALSETLMREFKGKPANHETLGQIAAVVNLWVDAQIALGDLYYSAANDRWQSK